MRLSAFDTYTLFLALKNHFTRDNYDFFRYRGKVNATVDSFMARRDRFQFQKLSRKYDEETMLPFLVSNFICGKSWVGDFLNDDAHDNYMNSLKRNQSFTYVFTNELDTLFSSYPPVKAFSLEKNGYSPVINYRLSEKICPETFVILNMYLDLTTKYDKILGSDDIIWSKLRTINIKYTPFVSYNSTKIKLILKDKIREYSDEGLPNKEQQARGEAGAKAEVLQKSA